MHPCATGTVAAHATRILVVEDDADIRSVLCEILRDHGFDVAAACNGRDALDQLRRGAPPSLILLDLMMPIMSGADFRAAQLATPELRGIPVVVLTADGRYRDAVEALGAAAAFGKPFDIVDLLTTIERVVGRGAQPAMASA